MKTICRWLAEVLEKFSTTTLKQMVRFNVCERLLFMAMACYYQPLASVASAMAKKCANLLYVTSDTVALRENFLANNVFWAQIDHTFAMSQLAPQYLAIGLLGVLVQSDAT